MKRMIALSIAALFVFALASCGTNSRTQIANPWKSFESLEKAQAYAGFELGMPETVSGTCTAASFRVLEGEKPLLQVNYQEGEFEVEVRKSPGEGQDISGIYGFENTETMERGGVSIKVSRPAEEAENPNAVLMTFDADGFSWSVYAPDGYWGDSGEDFLNAIFGG